MRIAKGYGSRFVCVCICLLQVYIPCLCVSSELSKVMAFLRFYCVALTRSPVMVSFAYSPRLPLLLKSSQWTR